MIGRLSYFLALAGSVLLIWAGSLPVNALTVLVPSCQDPSGVEYTELKIDKNGFVTAVQAVQLAGTGIYTNYAYSDVFADCKNGRMIVVRNDGEQPFGESVLFDRAAEASEPYTFRDIAGIMRDNGFDARVVALHKSSCLCEDGFATEPRY